MKKLAETSVGHMKFLFPKFNTQPCLHMAIWEAQIEDGSSVGILSHGA